ncbi:MAG TPA: glycosyltransferase, partial [Clostridia bacterium]|nr:glycosyltransferase [Clostridia bacterium]
LIVTSSTENKNHFKEFYPEFLSKVRVVPVPIDIDTSDYEKFEVKKPFILCVNSLRYHKNIHTLVKAFNLIKDRIEHNLILIGNSEWDEVDNISAGSDRIIFTGYISSAQRNYLYSNTDLFISPTMFEGFGMTPLEAMLFERKVLVSDIPVMRESTLGLAEYFGDIENEEILAGRILEVLEMEYPDGRLSAIKDRILEEYNPRIIADKIHSCLIGLVEADEDSN